MSANDAVEPVEASGADEARIRSAIRFERGNPSQTEAAAIVTVLAAASSTAPESGTAANSLWGDSRDRMRPQYFNGPNAYTSQTPLFWTKGS